VSAMFVLVSLVASFKKSNFATSNLK
jgi:hypothetical protein